jgi:hypothetical protein
VLFSWLVKGAGGPAADGAAVVVGRGGTRPTSGGTGGGASPPRSAGSEAIPAIAATAIAATRPTLAHLICLPATIR